MPITKTSGYFGIWRTSSLVVGNMVGSGIFMLPASLAIYGSLGLIGWLLSSLGAICLALVFSRLSQQFPKTGGPYAYAKEAFGDFVGFQMAWSYWIGAWAGNAAVSTAFVSYMSYFFPILKMNSTFGFLLAFSAIWFFTLLNSLSFRSTGIAQVAFTAMKVIPLVLISIFGIFYIKPSYFLPFNPTDKPALDGIIAAAALTLYAFLGLESATVPAEQVQNPRQTIPRATLIGTLLSAGIYLWSTVILFGVVSREELMNSNAPFAAAGEVIFGSWAGALIAGCAALAAFGTLNGWILLQGQIPFAAASDGLFPKIFAKKSSRGTPLFGLVISSFLVSVLLLFNYNASLVEQFTVIVNLTTFTILLPYLYSAAADWYFIISKRDFSSKAKLLRASFSTAVGFIYTLLIVIGCGQEIVFWGMMWIFLGFPVYAFMRKKT